MQIKTVMSYHFTSIKMATVQTTEITWVGKDVKKLESCVALLVAM